MARKQRDIQDNVKKVISSLEGLIRSVRDWLERGHSDGRASLKRWYVTLSQEQRERACQYKMCGKNIWAEQTESTVVSPEAGINWRVSTGNGPSE